MSFIKDMMIKIEEDGFYCKDNKFVCFNCIGNEAIKKYIMENTEEHYCDYCKSQDTYAIHISTLLSLIMEAIKYEWTDANNEVFWDSSEGGWQGTEVIDTYDLIYDKYYDELNIDNINLINDILNSINKKSWCKINPYSLREHEEDYYTWELFCNQIKYETRYMFFKEDKNLTHYGYNYNQPYEILYKISKVIEKLNLILCQDNIYEFYRGRTHDEEKGFNTVLELATPKKEFIKRDNRMSPAHIPMFYGAFDTNTVIEEIGGESKYISIGVFKNLKKLNLLDFTKIPALPSIFDKKNRYLRNAILFLMKFINDLSKPIEDDPINYIPTQVVCEYFKKIYKMRNGEKINGIIYYSSKNPGGKCCALYIENKDCTENKNEKDKILWLDKNSIQIYKRSYIKL